MESTNPALLQCGWSAGGPAAPPSLSCQGGSLEPRLFDPEAPDLSEERFAASLDALAEDTEEPGSIEAPQDVPTAATARTTSASEAVSATPSGQVFPDEQKVAWRDEISARLTRYRARRKMHPPHYPSLSLPFVAAEVPGNGTPPDPSSPRPAFAPISDQALALDEMMAKPPAAFPDSLLPKGLSAAGAGGPVTSVSLSSGAKILEFPRFAWEPPFSPADQLAEPVSERPRILEVPEFVPPPPALGGITIAADERQEGEMRPGIDIPVQSATLARRMFASAIDGLIIAVATALFGAVLWRATAIRPPRLQILGLAAVVPGILWAAYQYLLIIYGASTPGLRAAGLELARFEGTLPARSLRRWRVLAACLSAASLGMGYLWVFLDEDTLCWHDRITRTYLAPRKRHTSGVAR